MLKPKTYKHFLYNKHKVKHLKVKVKAKVTIKLMKKNTYKKNTTLPPRWFFQKLINNTIVYRNTWLGN